MKIKVLGPGCMKCNKLFAEAEKAVAKSGVQADLEKVQKLDEIVAYGVMMTPALVIDDDVVSTGKAVSAKDITKLILERSK